MREIRDEEKNYINAKESIAGLIEDYKKSIQLGISMAGRVNSSKSLKGKTVEQVYEAIMNGTREVEGNDKHDRDRIKLCEKRLKRGIRKPEQILEDMRIEPVEEVKTESLNL